MRILIDGQTFETPEIHRGIGIYTKNVINHMLKINFEHEWYIAVSDTKNLVVLDPWVLRKLHIIVLSEFEPSTDYSRNRVYTEKLQELIDQYQIDTLWIPNGMMVNVLFLHQTVSCKTFVTVYDLIPYIFPIKEWPAQITEEYHRRIQFLKKNDIGLLMISQATVNDWVKYIGPCDGKAYVIPLAADTQLFYCDIAKKNATEPYILFTGGFDYRKNIRGAIDAFALARKKYAEDFQFCEYKLVIVGKYNEDIKVKYEKILSEKGITGQVVLTGYVADEKLADLYRNAELFFFPSRYEGFGLPILEAMLSGDYVISADNSSLLEVCGGFATLCDADSIEAMADALYQGYLSHNQETEEQIRKRQKYALGYSWDRTAMLTLEAIERDDVDVSEKPSLALITPWPEQKTGIANYERKLVPYLQKYFHITVFVNNEDNTPIRQMDGIPIKTITESKDLWKSYDYRLFQIGNNDKFHKQIFDLLDEVGGIAEIHDFVLTPFFYVGYYKTGQQEMFRRLLIQGYGERNGEEYYQLTRNTGNHPDIFLCPMAHSVVKRAEKTIFHNHWSIQQVNENNAAIIPHPSFEMVEPAENLREEAWKKVSSIIAWEDGEVVVGCFGWVNSNKRPQISVDAVEKLIAAGYRVKLMFWGVCNDQGLISQIKQKHLSPYVKISGYLSDAEYYYALQMTDIVVNLRYPSMGEASGTLCEAMKMGKAIVVSDLNQYQEFPDEVCWKLPICEQETKLLSRYIQYLIDHPEVREAMGKNAKAYADYSLNPDKIAKLYYRFITRRE